MTVLLVVALLAGPPSAPHGRPHRSAAASKATAGCGNPLAYQVLLDRRGFSPGEIDGALGPNLQRAIAAFQASEKIEARGTPDCDTWHALAKGASAELLTDYTITEADVRGPFLDRPLPNELSAQAQLPALAYGSAAEAIAERFHASPELLRRLNPAKKYTAGTVLRVPDVTPFEVGHRPSAENSPGVSIEVSREHSTLRVVREDGTLVFVAPVSSGSEHDPLPIGTWKVTGVSWMPPFNYNPDLFWDAEPGDSKAVIKPGPNNPVGVVWIDINVPHYGIHGTPYPALVGHAQSHGCVRLTNWDAARLASLVRPGTRVVFSE